MKKNYDLDEVALWNYFGDPRSYYNNKTYVSKDNSNWTEILNEASIETSNGHRINAYTNTYNGYVSDGLVLWYDGYANTGADRNYTSTTWKDLSGKAILLLLVDLLGMIIIYLLMAVMIMLINLVE